MIRRLYLCPNCQGRFAYDHHPSIEADPLPDDSACPHCAFVSSADYAPAVTAPHIQRPIRNVVDNMHRQMEAGSEFRAQIAQEKFGLDASEAAVMKETNMRDHLHEGDTSSVYTPTVIDQNIAAAPQAFGFQGGAAQGAALSPQVQSGPFPNAGLRAMEGLRASHAAFTAGAGHSGPTTSSLPALETAAPNYRKRL